MLLEDYFYLWLCLILQVEWIEDWLAWRSEWPSFSWGGETARIATWRETAEGEEKRREVIQWWERLERASEVKGRELDTQHAGRMERVREQRPFCSLSKSQRDREIYCERDADTERRYTASSADREEGACRVPTQKSYSSSETLQAFDHDPSRMLFGGRVKEMVHKESAEYSRPGEGSRDILDLLKVITHSFIFSQIKQMQKFKKTGNCVLLIFSRLWMQKGWCK